MGYGWDVLLPLLLGWNLLVFLLMGIDKRQAVRNRRRIRETTLLACAFALGAVGLLAGMAVFRHKTKKALFLLLGPVALLFDLLLLVGLDALLRQWQG